MANHFLRGVTGNFAERAVNGLDMSTGVGNNHGFRGLVQKGLAGNRLLIIAVLLSQAIALVQIFDNQLVFPVLAHVVNGQNHAVARASVASGLPHRGFNPHGMAVCMPKFEGDFLR